jgi:hypothetical protein
MREKLKSSKREKLQKSSYNKSESKKRKNGRAKLADREKDYEMLSMLTQGLLML